MSMHDEASTHYIDLIDPTTLGHQFIKEIFGKTPRVGWQIDSFGHSAVQAYLLGAELGFDSLFFARIDYQDRAKRKNDKTLEVVWQGSKSLGSSSQIFTGIFPRHYDPPDGFTFEINDVSPPIQVTTMFHLDRPMYLLGYLGSQSRVCLIDKEFNVMGYTLLLSLIEYKTLVMRGDYERASEVLPLIPKEHQDSLITSRA